MNKWKQFINTKNGFLLREFFKKLNLEIATMKSKRGGKDAVLILNTRKGYWIYKIFTNNEDTCEITVRSDRFVKKILDFSFFKGKVVYLVDDTLNKGCSLLETYELLAKQIDSANICPVVFALHVSVDIQQMAEKCTNVIHREFWKKLQYYVRLSESELGTFCVDETELIHAEGIPFVIDLPYLKELQEKQEQKEMKFSVQLTKDQFNALKEDNELWKFHFVNYDYGKYANSDSDSNVKFQGFIIQLQDENLLQLTEEFAHDFIVEGSFQEDENNIISAIFIPFAILKSQDLEYQDNLWNALFPEKQVTNVDDSRENLYRKKYRENVFVLSMMVAQKFRRYFNEKTGKILQYDYDILKDHFTDCFIEEMKQLEEEIDANEQLMIRRLEKISGQKNMVNCVRMNNLTNVEKKIPYSDKEAGSIFSDEIRIRKVNASSSSSDNSSMNKDVVLTFEEIQWIFDQTFQYNSIEERRYSLTKEIILMLNVSICSNKLILDQRGKKIIRGFRYGENSDLLLPFFNVYFYWAVLLYEMKFSGKNRYENFDKFISSLEREFQSMGFLESDVEKRDFIRNSLYYKSQIKDNAHLNNKYCFLMPYMQGNVRREECYYLRRIENFIEKYEV